MSNNDAKNTSAPKPKPNIGGTTSSVKRGYIGRKRSAIAWDEIPQAEIGTLVHAVTGANCAIMFGRTSDEGALSITVLDGDERIREWPHTVEEYTEVHDWLVARYERD